MLFWDPMVQGNQPPFHVNRFEKADTRSDSICAKYENRSCFQASVLDEMLTVRENLTIRAQQYKEIAASRVDDLIHQLGLTAFQKQLYGTLSGGQNVGLILRVLFFRDQIFFSWMNQRQVLIFRRANPSGIYCIDYKRMKG